MVKPYTLISTSIRARIARFFANNEGNVMSRRPHSLDPEMLSNGSDDRLPGIHLICRSNQGINQGDNDPNEHRTVLQISGHKQDNTPRVLNEDCDHDNGLNANPKKIGNLSKNIDTVVDLVDEGACCCAVGDVQNENETPPRCCIIQRLQGNDMRNCGQTNLGKEEKDIAFILKPITRDLTSSSEIPYNAASLQPPHEMNCRTPPPSYYECFKTGQGNGMNTPIRFEPHGGPSFIGEIALPPKTCRNGAEAGDGTALWEPRCEMLIFRDRDVPLQQPNRVAEGSNSNHQLLAFLSCILFWPIGLLAIYYANLAQALKTEGFLQQSFYYSRRALILSLAAILLGTIMYFFFYMRNRFHF